MLRCFTSALRILCTFYRSHVTLFLTVYTATTVITTRCKAELPEAGGVYNGNDTLHFRDSPYQSTKNMQILPGANLTIEQGVTIYFDPGVGIEVLGVLNVAGDYLTRVNLLPRQTPMPDQHENGQYPNFRLVDGPTTRQGRLQIFHKNKWRAICTMNTNWTDVDYQTACRSMGFGDGAFWRWYRRNNDTYPFVMPRPGCPLTVDGSGGAGPTNFSQCEHFMVRGDRFWLAENLCQGEDDVGLMCWGPPTFLGWQYHWKGITFVDAPWSVFNADPDGISLQRRSLSSLQHVDIFYAGYDGVTGNTTGAVWVRGMPPFMNFMNVKFSARDGIRIMESHGPVEITNSTISFNRGHGIVVENSTDGRLFINETKIEHNYGDGVQYAPKYGLKLFAANYKDTGRNMAQYALSSVEMDACKDHVISTPYFPHTFEMYLKSGTPLPLERQSVLCYVKFQLPRGLPYKYTVQFLEMTNFNPPAYGSRTNLHICDTRHEICLDHPRYRIPVLHNLMPPSVDADNTDSGLLIMLDYFNATNNIVYEDIRVVMKVHATVQQELGQSLYGLNVSNSIINDNVGCGLSLRNVRDRTVITNVTVRKNQYIGLRIFGGVGDLWINNSAIDYNFGDGINVTYVGGSTVINGSSISYNRLRGIAVNYNTTFPFIPLRQEIIIKGKMSDGTDYKDTSVNYNKWGGILVGNFCTADFYPTGLVVEPRISVTYVHFLANEYHPAFEFHSCRKDNQPNTTVEVSASNFQKSTGFSIRVQPAVNIKLTISDNVFYYNERSALIIRNREHPQLSHLPATVWILRNQFKWNHGNFILNIGLNNHATRQTGLMSDQNEIRENKVDNPYPFLNPRNFPYAVLIVSSSNFPIHRNCFNNADADFEIATDLQEHGDVIKASENNWGTIDPDKYTSKIFDQFNRFTLARIEIDPVSAICNAQVPRLTPAFGHVRKFRLANEPYRLGGAIYDTVDLPKAVYTVVDDLHVTYGARLIIQPGTTLKFMDSVGLLVQGELMRTPTLGDTSTEHILFTRAPFESPKPERLRLVNDFSSDQSKSSHVTSGRLEINIDGQWGVVCNRSWHVSLAAMTCNQLGLVPDREFYEKWVFYMRRNTTELPVLMDIVRCEEWETDLTQCRHDSPEHNIDLTCPDIVGVRCVEPHWAGVRYSLLANPPRQPDQSAIRFLTIEKAGLLDSYTPEFCAALQIDWNLHIFQDLIIRDNWWNGIDVVYNDITIKPRILNSLITKNKRHGIKLRSIGISLRNVTISDNDNAGVYYDPVIQPKLQRDVYSWVANGPNTSISNVVVVSNSKIQYITLGDSYNQRRRFLIPNIQQQDIVGAEPVDITFKVVLKSGQTGLSPRIGVQIISRPTERDNTDEDMIFTDKTGMNISLRRSPIDFPLISKYTSMDIHYTKSNGPSKIAILLVYIEPYDYLDQIHLYQCNVERNQYGLAALHYSDSEHNDGSVVLRHRREQMWLQKTNFTANKRAVVWVHSPRNTVYDKLNSKIEYWIDNCSVTFNNGSIIETHRDLYSSSNVFFWKVYRSNFYNNDRSGMQFSLPDPLNFLSPWNHSIDISENDIDNKVNFELVVSGYYAWMNFSSNNFTLNKARPGRGLVRITGMEKELIMERNQFRYNKGSYMISYDIRSHAIARRDVIPARIWYNYVEQNYYFQPDQSRVESWPRSYAIGLLGLQKVNVSYNNFLNPNLDFEMVVGLKGSQLSDTANVTYNFWGYVTNGAELRAKIFDFDDWNIFSLAEYNPYFVTREKSLHFEWAPSDAQTRTTPYIEPDVDDLKGRLFISVTLIRRRDKWPVYPFYNKPDVPYRIRNDLTVMPGATLTIEKGVEVHLCPNVRILILGSLVAEGTPDEPIRFKPINVTEFKDFCSSPVQTNFSSSTSQQDQQNFPLPPKFGPLPKNVSQKSLAPKSRKARDIIDWQFPTLFREAPYFQQFRSYLLDELGNSGRSLLSSGFLHIYNETTGEMVPICDKQFTWRNAQVVCRELGLETKNAHFWLGPRYRWDPRLRIIKSYAEPRQCLGDELRFDECDLRPFSELNTWVCVDAEHFVYVHCGPDRKLDPKYVGHWGGLFFSHHKLEPPRPYAKSVLRHVEIVGAGYSHNDSSSSLTFVYHSVVLDQVNITNSSMHGLQILAPRDPVQLSKLNVTFNQGAGLNVFTYDSPVNYQSAMANSLSFNSFSQSGDNSASSQDILDRQSFAVLPYYIFGWVEMCSIDKFIEFGSRLILYYKYDSYPVDCVKYFYSSKTAPPKQIGFKFLRVNLFDQSESSITEDAKDDVIRRDSITFYDRVIQEENKIFTYSARTPNNDGQSIQSRSGVLAVHFRGNAADHVYGFIAELTVLPSPINSKPLAKVSLKDSRFEYNDRGAVHYSSVGENSPDLAIEKCYFGRNGYHVWGNFTTSKSAVSLDLRQTEYFMIQSCTFWRNQGGLHVWTGLSNSFPAKLQGTVKHCSFGNNEYYETLKLIGKNYQQFNVINNYVGRNRCPYKDVVLVDRMIVNFTHNTFYNNTGTHILDATGDRTRRTEFQTFYNNFFYDNVALGHGYQFYNVDYGFFPEQDVGYVYVDGKNKRRRKKRDWSGDDDFKQGEFEMMTNSDWSIRRRKSLDDWSKRKSRDVLTVADSDWSESGADINGGGGGGIFLKTSHEWYANIGADTERYRSTVLAGTSQQTYYMNFFDNPLNSFELATVNKSSTDAYDGPLKASKNYWGYPGTLAIANGRIRDEEDYNYLLKVDYTPVLETNTSLMDGFCPPGWFQAGFREWKSFESCYLFIPGMMPFKDALSFCKDQHAFMPFIHDGDNRLVQIAAKIDSYYRNFTLSYERYDAETASRDSLIWINGIKVPPYQCGVLSVKTGRIGFHNCENFLPFICQKGPGSDTEPLILQPLGIAAIVISILVVIIILSLLCLWYAKSLRRREEFFHRKNSLRSSIRSNKLMNAVANNNLDSGPNNGIGGAADAHGLKKHNVMDSGSENGHVTTTNNEKRPPSPDLVSQAYRNLILGRSSESISQLSQKGTSQTPYTFSTNQSISSSGSPSKGSFTTLTRSTNTSETVTVNLRKNPPPPKHAAAKTFASSVAAKTSAAASAISSAANSSARKNKNSNNNNNNRSPADYSPTTSVSNLIQNSPVKAAKKASTLSLVSFRKPSFSLNNLVKNQSSISSRPCSSSINRCSTCDDDRCSCSASYCYDTVDATNRSSASTISYSTNKATSSTSARTSTLTENSNLNSSFCTNSVCSQQDQYRTSNCSSDRNSANSLICANQSFANQDVKYHQPHTKLTAMMNGGVQKTNNPSAHVYQNFNFTPAKSGSSSSKTSGIGDPDSSSSWVPPNLHSFNRSTTYETSSIVPKIKNKPLETAM